MAKVSLRCGLCVLEGALRVGGEGRVKGGKALGAAHRQSCAVAHRREYVGAMRLHSMREGE